jgi:hypothetical protein
MAFTRGGRRPPSNRVGKAAIIPNRADSLGLSGGFSAFEVWSETSTHGFR